MSDYVMRHMIDEREPITEADIDQAQHDAAYLLSLEGLVAIPPAAADCIARLAAIVADIYGEPNE